MRKSVRITITISSEALEDLDLVSHVIGVSRSSLMSNLLSTDAMELRSCWLQSPQVSPENEQPPIRDRGASSAEIQARIRTLLSYGSAANA
jgi:hypothetical protein